jgi:IS5 family transposase
VRPLPTATAVRQDLLRLRLDQMVDLSRPLAKLDWQFLEIRRRGLHRRSWTSTAADTADGWPCHPETRARSVRPIKCYANTGWRIRIISLLYGEQFFCHRLPSGRSSLTRWRQRMGKTGWWALPPESLDLVTSTGAAKPSDFTQVIVDTTVQPKANHIPHW